MKIVQGDELELRRGLEHRGGTFHSRRLMEGEPGTLDNFQLNLGILGGDFYSPRHRHNFEQVRFQLAGTFDYARDGKLGPGMVGYYPEGVAYGPQSQDPTATAETIVLQCGGASGSGYLSQAEVRAGMAELQQSGEFKDGVFRRHAHVPGKRNTDAYQAIWEHVNGRPMSYPKPRYDRPFMMDPANYQWLPHAEAAGVSEKLLGVFTERRTEIRFLRLEPGASLSAGGRGLYVGVTGEGTIDGTPLRRYTTLFLERGERAAITARDTVELFHLGLPNLAGMGSTALAEAAE